MTKTPEQMAEEWAKAWRYEEVCHFALGNLRLCEYAQNEVQRRLNCGFLAGYKAAQQWISVKDRLPEYTPMVLAMCTDGYELAYYGMYGQGWTNTLGTEHLNVTHWQPLPAPPKEEK